MALGVRKGFCHRSESDLLLFLSVSPDYTSLYVYEIVSVAIEVQVVSNILYCPS